ncbi:MAG TPA: hypothetical protein VN026_18610 [Bacteroidia bacterium]|jgi:hypothetical protein|nr:hypothetical protein [Bacteroidia bacterium]
MQEEENIPVQAYYKWQLAFSYEISVETFIIWLNPFNKELKVLGYKDNCKILSPVIVKFIFEKIGTPSKKPLKRKK